jgi:uncharacterized protein (DUF2461 family)
LDGLLAQHVGHVLANLSEARATAQARGDSVDPFFVTAGFHRFVSDTCPYSTFLVVLHQQHLTREAVSACVSVCAGPTYRGAFLDSEPAVSILESVHID